MNYVEKEPFRSYSIYYDLIYRDKNYCDETSYVSELIHSTNPFAKNLLELGCGTGNYANFFCKKGFFVTGIEKSIDMLKQSKLKHIDKFTPVLGNMIDFKLQDKVEVAVALFHVISYLSNNEDVIACFKNVCNSLKDKGLFIFDVWYTPAVYFLQPEARVKEVENDYYKVTRHAHTTLLEEKNLVEVNYEIIISEKSTSSYNQIQETHKMRHFSTPEIELLAKICGFKLIRSEEFLTAKIPSINTWGVCYMLQKI